MCCLRYERRRGDVHSRRPGVRPGFRETGAYFLMLIRLSLLTVRQCTGAATEAASRDDRRRTGIRKRQVSGYAFRSLDVVSGAQNRITARRGAVRWLPSSGIGVVTAERLAAALVGARARAFPAKRPVQPSAVVPRTGRMPRFVNSPSTRQDRRIDFVPARAVFITRFCQLGFLHRPTFLHKLQTDTGAHSPFLLASMLALSARLTPPVVNYFGSSRDATRFFLSRAHNLLVDALHAPSLERIQALYLLSFAESVERNTYRAKVMLELARSMAATLELDKVRVDGAEAAVSVIEQEVRRRTWWCLQVDPTFETGMPRRSSLNRPLPAVPLPMDEQEFVFGTSTHDPVYLDSEPRILQLDKPIRTSLLGLLVLSRALLSDALGECTDGVPSPNSVEGLQARLAVIQASFTPFQMPTASNSLAYRSQDLDVSFHELHLNLLATRILLLLRGLNAKPDANVEEKEAATKSKVDLAIDVADRVEGLLRSRPGLILPPDL